MPLAAMPVTFSTDHLEAKDRFDFWRATFGSVHDVEIPSDRRQTFSAGSSHWMLDSILFGVYETPERRVVRSPKRCARDGIDHWVLRVPTAGRIVSRSGDDILVAQPGELIFGTFGCPYEESHVAGAWIAAMFPRDILPMLSGSPPAASVLRGARAHLLADFLRLLPNRLQQAAESDLPSIAEATRAVIAACVRPTEMTAQMEQFVLRERVNQIIQKNLGSARLDPDRICELAGLSRSTLYRMFEARGGVARHLQRLRLALVRSDLMDPRLTKEPIAKLAEARGLHSIASFNRAFRREFGYTPGDVRKAALLGAPFPLLKADWNTADRVRFVDLLA